MSYVKPQFKKKPIRSIIIEAFISDETKRLLNFIELVSNDKNECTEEFLAEQLNTSVTTIRRDACKLRSLGVIVHSIKRRFTILNQHLLNLKK